MRAVNDQTGDAWQLDSRFATGVSDGAWRVRRGGTVAVLKWRPASSSLHNPDAPAVAEYLRAAQYPTPAWLAWGTTADDQTQWSLQDFVDGEPMRNLDVAAAEVILGLVRKHRELVPPTTRDWNAYMRAHVSTGNLSHRDIAAAGPQFGAVLDDALALADPHTAADLIATEFVHSDFNVANILMRDGAVVAVVDIDSAGRGCAVYDVLSPAINGVSWASDPSAVDLLTDYAVRAYGHAPVAVVAACLVIENVSWYLTADPAGVQARVGRLRGWMHSLGGR